MIVEEKKIYLIEKGPLKVEFVVCTIDREANEVYVKFTDGPIKGLHQGLTLSSVENNSGTTLKDPQ